MVTPADFAAFQQQLRREVTDVMQQLRAEVNEAISGRMDMLNSINTALQNVSARPAETKPYRISDLNPRKWEGNNEKRRVQELYVRLALVDASMVKSRREDACHRRRRRQVGQQCDYV